MTTTTTTRKGGPKLVVPTVVLCLNYQTPMWSIPGAFLPTPVRLQWLQQLSIRRNLTKKPNGLTSAFFRWCHHLPLNLASRDFSLSLYTHTQFQQQKMEEEENRVDPRLLSTHTHPHTHTHTTALDTHRATTFSFSFYLWVAPADAFLTCRPLFAS
jgi:hypothetical protein